MYERLRRHNVQIPVLQELMPVYPVCQAAYRFSVFTATLRAESAHAMHR